MQSNKFAAHCNAEVVLHVHSLSLDILCKVFTAYLIKLKGTDLYITPSDEEGKINSQIILAKKNGTKLQQWTINEQHPTM